MNPISFSYHPSQAGIPNPMQSLLYFVFIDIPDLYISYRRIVDDMTEWYVASDRLSDSA